MKSSKTANLSSETQVNSDLRRDLMLKNQHIQTLHQEIAEFKRQGGRLRQENVGLNRFLPNRNIGGRFPQKEAEVEKDGTSAVDTSLVPNLSVELKSVKLSISELLHSMECFNSSASFELKLLRQIIAQFGTLLRVIFTFYKGQLKLKANETHKTSTTGRMWSTTVHGLHKPLTMEQFMRFVDDCGLVSGDVHEDFTRASVNNILVVMGVGTTNALERGAEGEWKVSYQQFCEVLVRIGIAKYTHRFAADRFAQFMEKEVFPTMDIKISKLMDEL